MSSQPILQPIANVHLSAANRQRVAIGHAFVDRCSFDETISDITAHALAGCGPAFVVTPNAQHIVLLQREGRLREIYSRADRVVPDGFSLVLAARILGQRFPERVAGVDLFEALCARAADSRLRVFLLGGRPGSANLAAAVLSRRFPGLQTATYCPPLGFERSEMELARIAQAVIRYRPHFIFVALGAPKQEYWIYDHGLRLSGAVCIGVGGSFEMVNGMAHRAPRWIQDAGCEWLYRLCLEPRRMWRRYLIGNLQFAWIVMQQFFTRSLLQSPQKATATSARERVQ